MIKHFEHLWEEAEIEANNYYTDEESVYNDIKNNIKDIKCNKLSDEDLYIKMGNVMFALCFLSKKYNINVYSALRDSIDDIKIALLD